MQALVTGHLPVQLHLDSVDLSSTLLERSRRFDALFEKARDDLVVLHASSVILEHIIKVIDVSSEFSHGIRRFVIEAKA